MTPPAHFALSEILILIISVYSIKTFLGHKLNYATIGVLILGATAFLATLRFGLVMHSELKSIHQLFTTLSLLLGLPLIVIEIIKKSKLVNENIILFSVLVLAIGSIYIFFQAKNLIIMISLLWLIIGIIFSFLIPREKKIFKFISVFVFSIILFNFIIRQAQVFDPILSWHFYHIMIAIWLYLITIMLTKKIAIYV